jgi:hypothetical protein
MSSGSHVRELSLPIRQPARVVRRPRWSALCCCTGWPHCSFSKSGGRRLRWRTCRGRWRCPCNSPGPKPDNRSRRPFRKRQAPGSRRHLQHRASRLWSLRRLSPPNLRPRWPSRRRRQHPPRNRRRCRSRSTHRLLCRTCQHPYPTLLCRHRRSRQQLPNHRLRQSLPSHRSLWFRHRDRRLNRHHHYRSLRHRNLHQLQNPFRLAPGRSADRLPLPVRPSAQRRRKARFLRHRRPPLWAAHFPLPPPAAIRPLRLPPDRRSPQAGAVRCRRGCNPTRHTPTRPVSGAKRAARSCGSRSTAAAACSSSPWSGVPAPRRSMPPWHGC